MESSPPPLFKQGPSALARLIVCVALALGLLITDAHFKALETVRLIIETALYPLQRAMLVPRDLALGFTDFFVTGATLRYQNKTLQARNLHLSAQASKTAQLEAENRHLRTLLQLASRSAIQTVAAEVQYDAADPFSQKVIIDRGSQQGIRPGAPVVNENGVVGQVTRVFPLQSEVTLLTDKDQVLPVQVVRTGFRSVIYGRQSGDTLALRFVPAHADIQAGDTLVTSGLDSIYPPGLPVAKVSRIDKFSDKAFARVTCVPISPVRGARQLLVLDYQNPLLPPPAETETAAAGGVSKQNGAQQRPKQ